MKRIVFIEVGRHIEVIRSYIDALKITGAVTFHIYSSKKLFNEILKSIDQTDIKHFDLAQVDFSMYGKDDLIIITSPIKFAKYRFSKDVKKYFVVHNINVTFFSYQNFYWRYFNLPSLIKNSLIPYFRNQSFYKQLNGFIFLSEKIILENRVRIKRKYPNQRLIFLPTIRYDIVSQGFKNDVYTVIIPGAFDEKRRKNNEMLMILDKFNNDRIKFIFLGIAPINFVKKAQSICDNNRIEIITYLRELEYKEYYSILAKANLIVLTNKRFKYHSGVKEKNGETTTMATLIDTFSLGIKSVIPADLDIPDVLNKNYEIYNSTQEIVGIVKDNLAETNSLKKAIFQEPSHRYFRELSKVAVMELLELE